MSIWPRLVTRGVLNNPVMLCDSYVYSSVCLFAYQFALIEFSDVLLFVLES